jgi:hypothetical protein
MAHRGEGHGAPPLRGDVMGAIPKSKEKMMAAIIKTINEAEFDWNCTGVFTEHNDDLQLGLRLRDPDKTVNEILAIVAGYISEVL